MNWGQFKGLFSHLCLAAPVVVSWCPTQEVAGSNSFNNKYFYSLNLLNSVKTFREKSNEPKPFTGPHTHLCFPYLDFCIRPFRICLINQNKFFCGSQPRTGFSVEGGVDHQKRPQTYVSLRLRVQNAVPAQPCVGKLGISLVLLNFLHCNFRLWFKTP